MMRGERSRPDLEGLPFLNGAYQSAEIAVSRLARVAPSLAFYPRMFSIVLAASSRAKRNRYDDNAWRRSSLHTVQALERAGVTFDISGLEHVAALEGPCVFVGNHMSTLETFVLPVILLPFKKVTYVVKQSLMDYPVFRHIMRSRDPVAVGRIHPREDLQAVLEGGVERLRRGVSMVIFPQTTRVARFDPKDFNTIGVKLAKRAGVPVIPLALKTDAWANGRLMKDFGRIDPSKTAHFAFGMPLRIRGRGNEEHEEIVGFITSKLGAWGGTVRSGG